MRTVAIPTSAPKVRLRSFAFRCVAPGRAAAEASVPVRCGYGACSKSGCNCKHYEGSGDTCANSGCGHAYSDHW